MWHFATWILYAMHATYILVLFGVPALIITKVATAVTSSRFSQPEPTIVVASGIQGHMVGSVTPQAAIFRGIPFSQPPTDEFRWMKPRQPLHFEETIWNATYNRPGCPQTCTYKSKKYTCPDETDEDCLYLNVWVPKTVLSISDNDDVTNKSHYVIDEKYQKANDDALAVMVYIHGGNFLSGAGSAIIYDSRFLAQQGNVIVVTINYRLGVFGFLVQGKGKDAATGNFGAWDQISALKWVQQNIKFFGGNPSKVTLFGQSSGAESVGVLMTSPHSKGLFHRGIMSSNPFALPLRDIDGARQYGAKFAEALKCAPNNMTCLRNAHVNDILQASNVQGWSFFGAGKKLFAIQPWGPVLDGEFLAETPLEAFKQGKTAQIPVIMGATSDEGMFFVPFAISFPLSTIYYQLGVGALMGSQGSAVLHEYPAKCESNCDNRYRVSSIVTDYIFTCPARRAISSAGSEAWFYIFDQTLPFEDLWESDMCNTMVCHCADLPFVFDNVDLSHLRFSGSDKMLARRMGFYWTNFAKYGNPNGIGDFKNNYEARGQRFQGPYNATYWPRFSDSEYGSYSAVKFRSEGDSVISDPYQNICDFWDGLDSYGKYR